MLRRRFPAIQGPAKDDICYATQNRQQVIKEIAPSCDVVIVVGSTNSSNSVRLVEVALDAGAKAGHIVDYAAEIRDEWLAGAGTVGVERAARAAPDRPRHRARSARATEDVDARTSGATGS